MNNGEARPSVRLPVRSLHPGVATGAILRLTAPLSLWGGTHPDGTISDPHHPQFGRRLTGRIVVVASGRGSSSSSSVLAELVRSGNGPAAIVLAEPDGILVLGALVAAELYGIRLPIAVVAPALHRQLPSDGEASLSCDDTTGHLDVATASVRGALSSPLDTASAAEPVGDTEVELTAEEQEILAGARGPGPAFAMRLVVALARASGAPRLLPVSRAHVDGCLYHGAASLDLAERLLELGATVAVPTTSNVGSIDLVHPELVHGPAEQRAAGRALMEAYARLGCRTTFTCAPYQDLAARPARGEHVAWAESNAIAFVNAVVGARTDRYGDFIDIAAAITGRAPAAGYHLDAERLATTVVDVSAVDRRILAEDAGWGVLGLVVGDALGTRVPAVVGAPPGTTEDQLKAFGAAAASAGGVGMFHVVGVTPEAPDLATALAPGRPERLVVDDRAIRDTRAGLSAGAPPRLDAISIGTPHLSVAELATLADLIRASGGRFSDALDVYVSTSRAVLEQATETGTAAVVTSAGAHLVVDTCTYVTTILRPTVRHVATNSAKWAWYAPSNLGVEVTLLTLAECVASACAGRLVRDPGAWGS